MVDKLRKTVLKDLSSMSNYCCGHGGELGGASQQYGYVTETENYRYCLRCIPQPGNYQGYLTCFDQRQQELREESPTIGKVSFASGETRMRPIRSPGPLTALTVLIVTASGRASQGQCRHHLSGDHPGRRNPSRQGLAE